ncbi:MAG: VWA domain-containing protein [Acidobacteria bacterium]|nr:VWA domain-containing protein [Acidobacteriota bacterium]MBI3655942.1 VWA domain-containing protein [Acidobacteriota bacterium]
MKVRALLIMGILALSISLLARHPVLHAQINNAKTRLTGNAFTKGEIDKKPRSTFKVDVNLVVVRSSVMDPLNRYVTGLEKEHFRLFEDKVEQSVVHFVQETAPISVGIIFDISGSMKEHFSAAKKSVIRFLENGNERDEFFLISFNHKVTLDADFTNQASNIQNIVSFRTPGGRTALYDAVYMGLDKIGEARHDKKAIIIITDGEDNSSRYSFSEVKELAKEGDVQIYAIAQEGTLQYGKPIIQDLVNLTGGRGFFPHSLNELDYYIDLIHAELRNQYVLGYHSTNKEQDGKWRKIKIKLEPPEGLPKLAVRAREGYYAQKK